MDISRLFDGLIKDGVFMSIGSAFIVEASSERVVNVGIGRAWFNNTWIYNDAILPLRLSECDILLNRIDAVVIEVNTNDNVRKNDVKIVKGEEASEPQRPVLSKENNCYQYPLAYIYVAGTADGITQANITNMVGTSECPFVTGIMQSMNADGIKSTTVIDYVAEAIAAIGIGDYAKVDAMNKALEGKVDKADGQRLMTDAEAAKLLGIATGATKTEASTKNGYMKVNGSEVKVYELPSDVIKGAIATDAEVEEMLAEVIPTV